MRIGVIVGAALIVIGGLILAGSIHYTTSHDVVDVGAMRLSTDEKKPVSPWVGGVLALAGLGLIFSSGSRKR